MIVSYLLFSATYICSWELPASSKETEAQLLGSFQPKSNFDVKLDFNLPRSHFFPPVPNFCHYETEKFSGLEKSLFWLVEVTILLVSIQQTLSHSGGSGDNVLLSKPQLLSWVPISWLGPKEVKDKLYPTNQWKTQWQNQFFFYSSSFPYHFCPNNLPYDSLISIAVLMCRHLKILLSKLTL